MVSIEIKNARSMFLKNGKVWLNGLEYTFRSHVLPDGRQVVFSDLPAGSYTIWIGVGQGKGGFRSKKIKLDYDGSPLKLQCSYGGFCLAPVLQLLFLFLPLLIPNFFYKLKRI